MQSTEPWRKLGVFSNLKNLMNKSYKKIASHEASIEEAKHVLLLYSGGLDTSVMLKWIKDEYQAEITTLTVDIGQQGDFELIKQKAINLGVKEAILIDAKEEFANSYITKAIKSNASYQGNYHLFCPLGRAIISQIAVKVAKEKNIPVVDSIDAAVSGEDIDINFHIGYLADCVPAVDSDSITLGFSGPSRPLVIRGASDPGFTYLVMPLNR